MKALLSSVQVRALEQLATYRFLTVKLMQRLKVGSDAKHLRGELQPLINKGLVGRTGKVPTLPGIGRLPHLYWLYQRGADTLAELHAEEPETVRTREYEGMNELPHLCAIIEAHVALREWAKASGASVDWFKGDYEPGSARGRKATTLTYNPGSATKRPATYTPDAIAQVTLADGIARLLVFEVYRGGWRYTLSHFHAELPKLRRVCETEAIENHYQSVGQARFLVLFHDAEMRDKALARWRDRDAEASASFYVKSMDELGADFAIGWQQPSLSVTSLF